MIHYWEHDDHIKLQKAETFSDLLPIALSVINRIPNPVVMVSGPISTGGRGSVEENLHLFSAAINILHNSGVNIFDQTPFDEKMQQLKKKCWKEKKYCMPLLEDFYMPIFQSRKLSRVYFLPDWETSFGAKWEFDQCKKYGIKTSDFPSNLLARIESKNT